MHRRKCIRRGTGEDKALRREILDLGEIGRIFAQFLLNITYKKAKLPMWTPCYGKGFS
jgi:hypothetical protein